LHFALRRKLDTCRCSAKPGRQVAVWAAARHGRARLLPDKV
jgi:hypothetical protein